MTIVDITVVLVVLLGAYWLFPVQDDINGGWVLRLVLGVAATAALIAWEVRAIGRSRAARSCVRCGRWCPACSLSCSSGR